MAADWAASRAAASRLSRRLALGSLAFLLAGAVFARADGGDTSGTPFVVHRVTNPHYRPPVAAAFAAQPVAMSRLRSLDRLTAQVYQHDSPGAGSTSHWQLVAGQQSRGEDGWEAVTAGGRQMGRNQLEALRLSGRRGLVSGGLGDLEPLTLGRLASLQRLRGGVLRLGSKDGGWLAVAGRPAPVPGQKRARLVVAGIGLEGARYDEAVLSLTGVAFARDTTSGSPTPDSHRGRGGAGALGWKVPIGRGSLSARLGGQLHDLEGPSTLAIQQDLQWELVSPRFAMILASERNTRQARVIGTDRFALAPRAEDRWSLQARSAGGRGESHWTGVLRRGGDESLETRTIACGLSGSFGRSAWYGGADAVWDTRPTLTERRFSAQAGRTLTGGAALLSRLEYAERPGAPGTLAALAEASLALPGGARLELEPRLGWAEKALQHGQLTTRLSCPLAEPSLRFTGTLAVGASRDFGFQGNVREAAIAVSCSPRLRDRGDLEVRRMDSDGRPVMEYSARYDATVQRYENPVEWMAARDTGRVTVFVGRSGNGSGMPDVLVSLDGQSLRFTDADGVARFEHVTPGIHAVAIEERSLAENLEVAGASRVFVTVERGRVPDPIHFTIARMERRTRF